jgi:hypothetical protein
MKGIIKMSKVEEEKTCKTCEKLQDNGFCGLQTANEVEECLKGGLSHWSSIYNPQYALNLDEIDNM